MKKICIIFCLLLLSTTLFTTSLLEAITDKHNENLLDLSTSFSLKDSNYVFEGFEDTDFPPFGWENPGNYWARFTTEAYEGDGYARCSWYHDADAILISPRLVVNGGNFIDFFWRNDNLYEAKGTEIIAEDTLFVEISNTYLDPNPTWECIAILSADAPMDEYEEVCVNIPDTYIGNDAKIRWRHKSNLSSESRGAGLDNITMPAPYLPVNFKVEPSYVSDHIGPGNSINFQYDVTNLGVQTDRYFIVVQDSSAIRYNKKDIEDFETSDGGWVAAVNVSYLDLAPSETGIFELTISIPEDATLDDAQLTPVLVYSREDHTLNHQVFALATCHQRDPYEPNDLLADATSVDYDFVSDSAQIYYDPYYRDKDIDIYTIDCMEGDIVSCAFELPDDETVFDGAIKLVDADSTELAFADSYPGGGSEYLQYRILQDGTYYWILGKWNEVLEGNVFRKTQTRGENTTYYTVTFDHIPSPEIDITPSSFQYGIIYQSGDTVQNELYISNTATAPQSENLEWDIDIQNADSLFFISTFPDSGSVPPGQTDMVIVTCVADSLLPAGTYTADLIVHNNALLYGASDITVPVTLYYADESGGLEGYVSYGGNPLVGVHIIVGNFETYTDENGYFSFYEFAIPGGFYTVYVYYEGELLVPPTEIYLDAGWIVLLIINIPVSYPPPENLTATAGYGCIYLEWDPPQTGGGTQVDYILDDGSYENSWAINPGYDCWLGNLFSTMDSGEIIRFEVYGDENVTAGDNNVWIDVFDTDKNYVGSSNPFVIPSNDWIVVPAPNIPFSGEFYTMIHWNNLPTVTNYVGFDENGPYANQNCDWYYDGTDWQLFHDATACNPGVFGLRATANLPDRNTEITYNIHKPKKEPDATLQLKDISASKNGQRVTENVFSQSGHTIVANNYKVMYITPNKNSEHGLRTLPDPILLGYNVYELNKGFLAHVGEFFTNFTDDIVAFGEEYTYWVTAVYDLGESGPSNTATATPLPPPGGYHEPFDQNWTTTGWVQEPPDGNWMWSPGYAYLSWSPSVPNYDMSLISPEINLIGLVWDLVVKMYINDYSTDNGEAAEIWVIHDAGETMIFEWDLDSNDDWGVPGGTNWSYDMSQFTGQTIQLKFRSYGGDTYNFNYWYIYDVLINLSWIPPDYGALEGTVTDSDSNPIQYARVTVDNADYNPVYTDEDGHYMIRPMITGLYDVQFYKDGYSEAWYYDVEIDSGDTTVLDVMLGNPTMEIYPTSLEVTLTVGGSTTEIVTVTNNGTIPLNWYIGYPPGKGNRISDIKEMHIKSRPMDVNDYSSDIEVSPSIISFNQPENKYPWNLMFNYPCAGAGGEVGVETNGNYIYTTDWGFGGDGIFYRYDMDGNLLEQFSISGILGGIRDLAYDGEYFYGGTSGDDPCTVYVLDLDNEQLVSTFTAPTEVRAIAYDPYTDNFWANNWSSDITSFDRSGNYITAFPCGSYGNYYGLAYDIHSTDWPYLWGFSQDGSGGVIVQIDPTIGLETGFTYDVVDDIGQPCDLAGGLFIHEDEEIWGGLYIAIIGGLIQNNIIFGYHLCSYLPQGNLVIDPTLGTVDPYGGTQDVDFNFYALDDTAGTTHVGEVIFLSNQGIPSVTLPISLTIVDTVSVEEPPATKTALHPNFPNPMLNTTTFNFSLKERSHVTLSVYNIKGQLVEILLDEELDPTSSHNVEWDGTANGRKLANGIYFYKLETNSKTFLKKMILMR